MPCGCLPRIVLDLYTFGPRAGLLRNLYILRILRGYLALLSFQAL